MELILCGTATSAVGKGTFLINIYLVLILWEHPSGGYSCIKILQYKWSRVRSHSRVRVSYLEILFLCKEIWTHIPNFYSKINIIKILFLIFYFTENT